MNGPRPAVFLVLLVASGIALLAEPAVAKEAGKGADKARSVTVTIQGVLASRGEDPKKPRMDASLAEYRELLMPLGFGKYENIGRAQGTGRAGQTLNLKVGSYTVELQIAHLAGDNVRVGYTVKDSRGQAIGTNALQLQPGAVVPVMLGDPTVPVVLLFSTSR